MYALVMNGCDSVDIAEDIDTLLAQYTDKEVKAISKYGKKIKMQITPKIGLFEIARFVII